MNTLRSLIAISFAILLFIIPSISFAAIDLDFSHKRGYYDNAFQLTIAADDINATIIYTTDNSKPSFNNGSVYNGAISINNTAAVKAFAYSNLDTGKVRTHSYIFLDDVINSSNMYTYITQDPVYQPQLVNSFKSLPVVSLVSPNFSGSNAIDAEVETSVEMFFPDGSRDGFMIHSGIQTWGGSPTNPKKHYRLEFKEIYGDKKLKYDIFKPDNYDSTAYKVEPAKEFNKLILRGGSQDGLNAEFGNEYLAQFVRNRVSFDTQIELGYPAPHGRFVHVFVNGDYNGQFHLMERPDAAFFESYYGGDETEYEVYKSGNMWDGQTSVNGSAWNDLQNHINLSSQANIDATNDYIDLDQAAAYMLLMSYASGFDWSFDHNCLGGGNIVPGNGGYKFILWDVDFSLFNGGHWHPQFASNINYFDAPVNDDGPLPNNLVGNVEFDFMMADKMECECFNDGILTPNKIDSMYMHRINQVNSSLIAESARWGGYNFNFSSGHVEINSWDVNEEFTAELNRVRNNYFPNRTNNMVSNWKSNNLTSNINAVQFNQYGGFANNGFNLVLTNPNANSQIYYTLDGTDPRSIGGAINANAILYNGAINLPIGPVTVKARVRNTSGSNGSIDKWSAMCPRKFYVGQNYDGLVINEIHYNPNDSIYYNNTLMANDTVSGTSFEFIELKNTTNSDIYLTDVSITKGVSLKIETPLIIAANDFVVLAEDAVWFNAKYGFDADYIYQGKLSNSGENIWLLDPLGNLIDSLRYNDKAPWDTIPDDGSYSLALIDELSDNGLPVNWSIQNINYTPKAENTFCEIPLNVSFNVTNATCAGYSDGTIFSNVSNGETPYYYSWNTGSDNGFLFDIEAGTYILNILDNAGCRSSDTIEVTEPIGPSVIANVNDESALNANDGSINLTVSGAEAPYTYTWSNGAISSNLNNLSPDNYSVEIADNNNCTYQRSYQILEYACPNLNGTINWSDESGLNLNDGVAVINANNQDYAPYTYTWSNGASGNTITGLSPGFYNVTVTGILGCTFSESVQISEFVCADTDADNICDDVDDCLNDSFNLCYTASPCASVGNDVTYEYIGNVTFNTINNSSGANGGYGDFKSISTDVIRNGTYNVSLTPIFPSTTYNEYWNIWIDFNKDGVFDATEIVFSGSGNAVVTGTATIPSDAVFGNTVMRVKMDYTQSSSTNPCDSYSYGETEDYGIFIGIDCGADNDSDNDGVCDALDQCANYNDNIDSDGDGIPDACDLCDVDVDNDGVCDDVDLCIGFDDNFDADNDGTPDGCDACPNSATGDSDNDGICDNLDICQGFDDNLDADNDNIPDGCDTCPNDANNDADNDGVCDDVDLCLGFDDNLDSDNDNIPDACDTCPNDSNNDSDNDGVCDDVDICIGFDDNLDADNDNIPDGCDTCPNDANNDSDNDGVCDDVDICIGFDDNLDADNDNIPDGCDACPNDANNDSDNDGVCDDVDLCLGFDDNIDSDNDNIPDACDTCPNDANNDADNDGVCDDVDLCLGFDDNIDSDNDGIADGCDLCPNFDDSLDSDNDNIPDGCDTCPNDANNDSDNDGVCDDVDLCLGFDDNLDSDNDGIPNGCDTCPNDANNDADNDGVCDDIDLCLGFDDNIDADNDNIPDACDTCPNDANNDADNDGICDDIDLCLGFDDNLDSDNDGIADGCDLCPNFDDSLDSDNDNIPDGCDTCPNDANNDADNDGVCDDIDLCLGFDDNLDSDNDGIPNACDTCPNDANNDADNDGICDDIDLCLGFDDNLDADNDNIPDACDTCPNDANNDADNDGICDDIDLCLGFDDNIDSDNDGTADGCDLCPNFDDNIDADNDGIPDACDPDCDCANSPTLTETFNVVASNDDAEEDTTGLMNLTSGDLDLIQDNEEQYTGIRFQNINLDANATITNAYIQFAADEVNTGITNLFILAENIANANAYTSVNADISSRNYFTDTVFWNNIPAWNAIGAAATNQQTPDLTNLLNNILQQNNWQSGNAISFTFQGTGVRTAESFDGDGSAPQLIVEFTNCEDADEDGTADLCDVCVNLNEALIGTACDDFDACTINDTWQSNCECEGTYVDSDNDNVCDAEDVCEGFDDNLDLNNNGIPDGCENLGCPNNLTLNANPEATGTYQADDYLESTSKINSSSGGTVNYNAGDNFIELQVGFDADGSVNFNAEIIDCDEAN